jgi:4-amino-4-deoxy-L-arabinose transferase-like glycosyltransferase
VWFFLVLPVERHTVIVHRSGAAGVRIEPGPCMPGEDLVDARLTSRQSAARVLVLLAGTFALSLVGISRDRFNGDERWWMIQGERSWELLCRGEWDHPFWSEDDLYFGRSSPPVAKYLIGIGMQVRGKSIQDNRLGPPADVLAAGRLSSAVLGALGILAFYATARRAFGDRAALLGSVLLALSPLWVTATRHAMVDIHAASLSLVSVFLFVRAISSVADGGRGFVSVGWFTLSGAAAGLAVGAKFNAAGVPASLGVVLLVFAVRAFMSRSPDDRSRPWLFLLAGICFTCAAVASFVSLYPYLHDDPLGRFVGVIKEWRDIRMSHVEHGRGRFAGTYAPGLRAALELARCTVWPGKLASRLLILPILGAAASWMPVGRRLSPAGISLAVWCLSLPAAVVSLFQPSRLVHIWIVWAALLPGAVIAVSRYGRDNLAWRDRQVLGTIGAVALGALATVVSTTCITWPRYYLPLVPWFSLLAGVALARLVAVLAARRMLFAKVIVYGCLVAQGLAVVFAYPEYGVAKLARVSEMDWSAAPRFLSAASAVGFCALPIIFWWSRGRLPGRPSGSE